MKGQDSATPLHGDPLSPSVIQTGSSNFSRVSWWPCSARHPCDRSIGSYQTLQHRCGGERCGGLAPGTCQCRFADFALFVGHAPIEAASTADKDALWQMFAAALSQEDVVEQEFMIMLDANTRVGSVTSAAIGPSGSEEQNDSGHGLQQHLLGAELFAVNTVSSSGPTWKARCGASYKLDDVILPQSMRDRVQKISLADPVPVSEKEILVTCKSAGSPPVRKPLVCDTEACLRGSVAAEARTSALTNAPLIPGRFSVEQHERLAARDTRRSVSKLFPFACGLDVAGLLESRPAQSNPSCSPEKQTHRPEA